MTKMDYESEARQGKLALLASSTDGATISYYYHSPALSVCTAGTNHNL